MKYTISKQVNYSTVMGTYINYIAANACVNNMLLLKTCFDTIILINNIGLTFKPA